MRLASSINLIRSLFFLLLLFLNSTARSQVIQPSGASSASTTTCSGNYYDMGGSGGNYTNNQNSIQTICPVNFSDVVTINFTSYATESGFDYIYVYDGPNTSCPLLASLTGNGGPVSYTAKNCGGCLTINFYADFSNVAAGFSATISCSTPASYNQIGSTTGGGAGASSGPQCFVYSCATNYYDPGGSAANYQSSDNSLFTICSSTAGQAASVTFNAFNTEAGFDWLAVFDGPSNINSNLLNVYSGTPATPFTVTGTTANTSGCLTFWFASDGGTNKAGWQATIACAAPVATPSLTNNDCWNSTPICNTSSLPGNSSGAGFFNELSTNDEGCLGGENQSSWYHFQVSAGGTFTMGITPSNGTDDYDYALWGPMTSFNCLLFQSANTPVRCSYACYGASCFPGSSACASAATGISSTNNNPQSDNSENGGGNCWTQTLNVNTGEDYILLIDNFLSSSSNFTLSLGGTCSINCVPIVLPIGVLNFLATPKQDKSVSLTWTVDGETNEKMYLLERSGDGKNFSIIGQVNTTTDKNAVKSYSFIDHSPLASSTNYYRLSSVDLNGVKNPLSMAFANLKFIESNFLVYPNPARNELKLDLGNSPSASLRFEIYDIYGKLVFTSDYPVENGGTSQKIDISFLDNGAYFIRANDGTNAYNRSLVISRE